MGALFDATQEVALGIANYVWGGLTYDASKPYQAQLDAYIKAQAQLGGALARIRTSPQRQPPSRTKPESVIPKT